MFIQIPTLPEHFPTSLAFKSLLDGVGFHVEFVVFEIGHHFAAPVTLVRVVIVLDATA